MKQKPILNLTGQTAVFIDWANVHGWETKLKWVIDPKKLYRYLKSYPEIKSVKFFFGQDTHPASKNFLREIRKIGYQVVTKAVKYLPVRHQEIIIYKRKCDFDLEIGLDAYETLDQFTTFVFFSGDGDFATLYTRLIKKNKKVVVISSSGSLGKEITQIKKGVYILKINRLKEVLKKIPPRRRRGA